MLSSHYPTAESIRTALKNWQEAQKPSLPLTDEEALKKLQRRNVSGEEIQSKLNKLRMNNKSAPPRYIANYTDLQALNRLEEANHGYDLSNNPEAANILAIMQAAEICLLNIQDLAPGVAHAFVLDSLDDTLFGPFGNGKRISSIATSTERYAWISSFHKTLVSLGEVLKNIPANGSGTDLSINDSPHFAPCLNAIEVLHKTLLRGRNAEPIMIDHNGIDLNHQNFIDTNYIEMWEKSLGRVHVPGVLPKKNQKPESFYKDFIGTKALNLAVNELSQVDPPYNFLRQFRAYHQISEILTAQTSRLLSESITALLDPKVSPMQAQEYLDQSLKMLDIVNNNLEPIAKNLSFHEYHTIRDSLGITSGSDSPNIRSALFAPLYGLLVAAAEQRAMGLKENFTKEELAIRLQHITESRNKDQESHLLYGILHDVLGVHEHINAWRNAHLQFIKTQIGFSDDLKTASISGTNDAYLGAKGFFDSASKHDPIGPIFYALTGKEFIPEPFIKTSSLPYKGIMGDHTAKAVKIYDGKVERRVNKESKSYQELLGPKGELVEKDKVLKR